MFISGVTIVKGHWGTHLFCSFKGFQSLIFKGLISSDSILFYKTFPSEHCGLSLQLASDKLFHCSFTQLCQCWISPSAIVCALCEGHSGVMTDGAFRFYCLISRNLSNSPFCIAVMFLKVNLVFGLYFILTFLIMCNTQQP